MNLFSFLLIILYLQSIDYFFFLNIFFNNFFLIKLNQEKNNNFVLDIMVVVKLHQEIFYLDFQAEF
jgi:hypothetical protein